MSTHSNTPGTADFDLVAEAISRAKPVTDESQSEQVVLLQEIVRLTENNTTGTVNDLTDDMRGRMLAFIRGEKHRRADYAAVRSAAVDGMNADTEVSDEDRETLEERAAYLDHLLSETEKERISIEKELNQREKAVYDSEADTAQSAADAEYRRILKEVQKDDKKIRKGGNPQNN